MQISQGHLVKQEIQEPGNISRTTASIRYNRELAKGNWVTSLIWGRNSKLQGNSNTYLIESTLKLLEKNYFYTRMELADREGLLEENIFGRPALKPEQLFPSLRSSSIPNQFEPQFRVGAFTFGGIRHLFLTSKLLVGLGTDITVYHQPDALKQIYGNHPVAIHFFIRIRPGKMNH